MNKLKLSKDDKRRRKQYRKDYKNAIKLLHQAINKKYGPWDNFLKIIFPIILDHWKKYYSLGYDVYAYEIKDTPEHKEPTRPTRYEIACELEKLYTEWVQFPKYMDFFEWNEEYQLLDGSFDNKRFDADCEAAKKKFFDYYIKYADDMWD